MRKKQGEINYDLEKIPEQFKRLFEIMACLYKENTPDSLSQLKEDLFKFPIAQFRELIAEYQGEDHRTLEVGEQDRLVSCLVGIFNEKTYNKGNVSDFLKFLVDNLQ